MLRFATALGSLLLLGFQAAPPVLPDHLARLMGDAEAARSFDYMRLKSEGSDLTILNDAAKQLVRIRAGADERDLGGRCMTDAELEVRMGLEAGNLVPDATAFEADKVAAANALNAWATFSDGVFAGDQPAEQPLASIASWVRGANNAPTDRQRELFRRVGQDQALRHAFGAGQMVWGELSPGALSRVHAVLGRRICNIDGDNTAWLRTDIAANGWYRISTTSAAADNAAWLLSQHADRNPQFQREVLAILEPLVALKETSPSSYAYLRDRVAVNEDRPQRYGTQGGCIATNVWAPDQLEDSERVQALRDDLELGSLAEYTAHMHQYCADFTPPAP